jgi:hypothetical protein
VTRLSKAKGEIVTRLAKGIESEVAKLRI